MTIYSIYYIPKRMRKPAEPLGVHKTPFHNKKECIISEVIIPFAVPRLSSECLAVQFCGHRIHATQGDFYKCLGGSATGVVGYRQADIHHTYHARFLNVDEYVTISKILEVSNPTTISAEDSNWCTSCANLIIS